MQERFDLGPSWNAILESELSSSYIIELQKFLAAERAGGSLIYPPKDLMFNAFHKTPFEKVSVVIVGQDPYHGAGQAHGLSFSVPKGVRPPPSLLNIYKEVERDIGPLNARHGCLEGWAEQGVLLLNALLSVRAGEPASHKNRGWERFTDAVLAMLNGRQKPCVFMLWGKYAQQKGAFLDKNRHFVLQTAHPSPLSAVKFRGNSHFSQANNYLVSLGERAIAWNKL